MYKRRVYGRRAEVVCIDGKLNSASIVQVNVNGFFVNIHWYFMHDGELYLCKDVLQDFFGSEDDLVKSGKVKELFDSLDYKYEKSSTAQFRHDWRVVRKLAALSSVQIGTADVVLNHYFEPCLIHVRDNTDENYNKHTVLEYEDNVFRYGTGCEPVFDGYPDMQDSSVLMNFMLDMGNVQNLQNCISVFEEYTKRMNIQY